MNEKITQKNNKKNKWTRIMLVVSLSVNLLIFGAFIGTAVHFTKPFWGISEKQYAHIEKLLKPHLSWFKTQRLEFKKDLSDIAVILKKQKYDRREMQQKLQQIKQKVEQTTTRMADISINVIDQLTPQERHQLANMIEKNIKRKKHRRHNRF